jgi:hypothetical protein
VKGWKKDVPGMQKLKASRSSYYSHIKADFKQKSIRKAKEGHYILIKGTIQENMTVLNRDTLNTGSPKFIEQIFLGLKERMSPDTITVGDLK